MDGVAEPFVHKLKLDWGTPIKILFPNPVADQVPAFDGFNAVIVQ